MIRQSATISNNYIKMWVIRLVKWELQIEQENCQIGL